MDYLAPTFNALQWPIRKKIYRFIWDAMQDYDKLSGNGLSQTWKMPLMLLTKMLLINLMRFGGGSKVLIVTWSNLAVMWKVRPQMSIIL